jgi:hypothetical protein
MILAKAKRLHEEHPGKCRNGNMVFSQIFSPAYFLCVLGCFSGLGLEPVAG